MPKFAGTFGANHMDGKGNPLGNKFVKLEAKDFYDAQAKMYESRGNAWAFVYHWVDFKPQIKEYGLEEVPMNEVDIIN